MRWLFAGLLFSTLGVASELAPHLDPSALAKWHERLKGPFRGQNLERLEVNYQRFVQKQTYRDLQAVYDPKNQSRLEIAYPVFVPEGGKPGADRGFGFHVVKRLVLDLPGGAQKVIDVNEQWAENRTDHGLYLPDEIRIKTRIRDGERHVPGSERDFLYDSIRLAWSETSAIAITRQSRYEWNGGNNRMRQLRVPVSAPVSCLSCHNTSSIATLSEEFLAPGETMSSEAIVQRSFFKKSYSQMKGYREYVEYLSGKVSGDFLDRVKRDLQDPVAAFAVPGLVEALEQEIDAHSSGFEDEPLREGMFHREDSQGVYRKRDVTFVDYIEFLFEGKYRWWEPVSVVPRPKK